MLPRLKVHFCTFIYSLRFILFTTNLAHNFNRQVDGLVSFPYVRVCCLGTIKKQKQSNLNPEFLEVQQNEH
jgi:hypothetical protein